MQKNIPFLDSTEIEVDLNKALFTLMSENKVKYSVGPLSTRRSLYYHYTRKKGSGNFSTCLDIKNLDKIFHLKMDKSLNGNIDINARHKDLNKLSLSQKIHIRRLGLKHRLKADISGFHRFIGGDVQSKIHYWFDYLGGSIKSKLVLDDMSKLKTLIPKVELKGSVNIDSNIDIIPKKSINIKMFSHTDGIDLNMDQRIDIKQFKADLDLEKTFHIINSNGNDISDQAKQDKYLSSAVMSSNALLKNTIHQMKSRFNKIFLGNNPTFSFRSLNIPTSAIPVEINHARIDFDLNKGLPRLKHVQFGIWDGTVIASASLIKNNNENLFAHFQTNFSGIDFNKILKNNNRAVAVDSEINGQLSATFPISSQIKEVLADLNFRLRFNHIGRLALERLLYALDPYENNEVIISQRKLLKTGTPICIDLIVKDGNLSLTGQLIVAGITINLPPLKRFSLTGISDLESIETKRIGIHPVIQSFFQQMNVFGRFNVIQ